MKTIICLLISFICLLISLICYSSFGENIHKHEYSPIGDTSFESRDSSTNKISRMHWCESCKRKENHKFDKYGYCSTCKYQCTHKWQQSSGGVLWLTDTHTCLNCDMEENCSLVPTPLDDNGDDGCYHDKDRFMSAVNSAMERCEKCKRQQKCEMEMFTSRSHHKYSCKHANCNRIIESKCHYKPINRSSHECTMCDIFTKCLGTRQIKWHSPRKTSPCQQFRDYESVIWRCGDSEKSVCGKSCGRDLVQEQIVKLNSYCCNFESDITKTVQWTILLDTDYSPSEILKDYKNTLINPYFIKNLGIPIDVQGQSICYRHHALEVEYVFPCGMQRQKCRYCGKKYLNTGSSHNWNGTGDCEYCHTGQNTQYPVEL